MLELTDTKDLARVGGGGPTVVWTPTTDSGDPSETWGYFSCNEQGYNVKFTGNNETQWTDINDYTCTTTGGYTYYEVRADTNLTVSSDLHFDESGIISGISSAISEQNQYMQIGYDVGGSWKAVYDSSGQLDYYDNGTQCVAPAPDDSASLNTIGNDHDLISPDDILWGGGNSFDSFVWGSGDGY